MRAARAAAAAAIACLTAVASEGACREPEPAPAPGTAHSAPSGNSPASTPAELPASIIAKEDEGEELLALAGDQLLLWSAPGRARRRSPDGSWAEFALPLAGIREARAQGADVLLVGQDPTTRGQAVSWVGSDGKERRRWALPKQAGFGAVLDPVRMLITIESSVSPLEPDGTLGTARALPEDVHASSFGGPRWIELGGGAIVCHGADLSLASSAPGHCRRLGAAGWDFEGPFVSPPLECGPWLLVSSSADGKALEVRDAATGQPQGRAMLPTPPVLACAGPNEAVLGTRDLALRRLPSLDVTWHRPLGKKPVRQLAVTEHFVAYVLSDAWDVWLAPRPTELR